MPHRVGLVGFGLIALVLATSTTAASGAEGVTDRLITVRYAGTLEAHAELQATHPRGLLGK